MSRLNGRPGPAGGGPLRVVYSFPHTLGRPGISLTALKQVEGLIDLGVSVSVYCTSLARPLPSAHRVVQTLVRRGRRIPHRAIGVQRAYAYHDRRVARALRGAERDAELVHAWPAGCLRTLREARRLGIPSLREAPSAHTARAYTDAERAAEAIGTTMPKGHHHRFDAGKLARELEEFEAADAILCPSDYVRDTFIGEGHPEGRLVRHRYGFEPGDYPVPTSPPNTDRPLQAIYVGRGDPAKGLHHALSAWTRSTASRRGRLSVAGDIGPQFGAHLGPLLSHPGVTALGFVTDIPALMATADILILPTATEGSALVTYEAMGSGVVLLASNAAGADARHEEDALIHAVGDVDELTRQLDRLDADRELLASLRSRALARRYELSWAAAGDRLLSIYRSRVDGSAPPPS